MDRTITISGTYTPFLLHVSAHMAPWRLVFALVIPFIMLAYVLRLIPRKKLKEINQALMIGPNVRRARLQPHIESYADKVMARSEEHKSELQSLMRNSYADLCLN